MLPRDARDTAVGPIKDNAELLQRSGEFAPART